MNILASRSMLPENNHPVKRDEDLKKFLQTHFENPRYRFATVCLPFLNVDPLACLEIGWKENRFNYYWENPSQDFSIAAGETLFELTAEGPARFETIRRKMKTVRQTTAEYRQLNHSYAGTLFLGGFSFFDHVAGEEWKSFPASSFTVPRWAIVKDGQCSFLMLGVDFHSFESAEAVHAYLLNRSEHLTHIIDEQEEKNDSSPNKDLFHSTDVTIPHAEYDRWAGSVEEAKDHISREWYQKIVLARKISVSRQERRSPTHILNILRQQYPSCYNFLLHRPGNTTFMGSTPERLASFRNNRLLTEALAGSIERGKTAAEDTCLERQLTRSSKNRQEHSFVVEDIEQRLASLVNDFQRSGKPGIKKLSNVQHLYTSIRARLKDGVHPLAVVEALHPTPAVGGFPRRDATPFIRKLENFNRGWYAGPVGWLNNQENGDFAVGIRSGLVTASAAHFFAGCGIVGDSDASAEWQETNLKLEPMLSVLQYD